MSKYTMYYISKQETYRNLAHAWKVWANEANLPDNQKKGMSLFFTSIGKRFGLITEFKEIGVI